MSESTYYELHVTVRRRRRICVNSEVLCVTSGSIAVPRRAAWDVPGRPVREPMPPNWRAMPG
jgi:hypothetical protein